MSGTVRIAVAVGYLGAPYSGSQIQPNVSTVQGELQIALSSLKWANGIANPITMSSRTDAGVDARMNICSFDIDNKIWLSAGESGIISAINDRIPLSIRVWAVELVPSDFRPRDAFSRTYLYRLQAMEGWPNDVSLEDLDRWCSIFIGKQNFRNFCRPEEGRSTIKEVFICKPWLDSKSNILGFQITGSGFVWNQVRRIASSLHRIATGRIDENKVKKAIDNPNNPADFGLADSNWLSLWALNHPESPKLTLAGKCPIPESIGAGEIPSGRQYRLWAKKARGEQDSLHQVSWLGYLN